MITGKIGKPPFELSLDTNQIITYCHFKLFFHLTLIYDFYYGKREIMFYLLDIPLCAVITSMQTAW